MKKFYVLLAVAAMLASCAETDLVNPIPESEPEAIGFETFAQKATKAENSTATYTWSLSDHHTSFYVWGYKNLSSNYVLTQKKVSYADNVWSYIGLVYWDKAATDYEFYAAAPATSSIWTLNEKTDAKNDDYFTTSDFVIVNHNATEETGENAHKYKQSFKNVANATDLMIAAPKNVEKAAFGIDVQLDFIHILSRLNITVSKDATLASQTVTLNSLTIHNMKSTGRFDENITPAAPATLAGGTHERWAPTTAKISYTALENEVLSVKPVEGDAEYMLQALVMPQIAELETVKLDGTSTGLEDPYFTIVYTITDAGNIEQFSASYNLATAFTMSTPANIAFNEGWQNTLNIVIKPTTIAFTGQVATWGVGSGSGSLDI